MFRFLDKKLSLGANRVAADILYSMCDVKDKHATDLTIKHFKLYRNNLAAVLEDKLGFDFKTYHQLSSPVQAQIKLALATDLEKISSGYQSLYDHYRKSDDRHFLSIDKGIVHNEVELRQNVFQAVSYCLPDDLFKERAELKKQLLPVLKEANITMADKLREQKALHTKRRRCCV